MTEPTQTPRTEADALNELRVKAVRELDAATLRIAGLEAEKDKWYAEACLKSTDYEQEHARADALESQLRTQATEHSLANRRLEDEIGRLQKEVEHQTLHADALELAERGAKRMAYEAQARVKQLEGALLLDTPWPITEILANLHDATDHLFKIHDCDHQGYEMWLQAQMQAVTCCQLLTDALSPSPPAVAKRVTLQQAKEHVLAQHAKFEAAREKRLSEEAREAAIDYLDPPAVDEEFVAALESKLASMSDTELTDAMIRAGFELDPLAVKKAQSLSEVKAAFAAGKRVQCSAVGEVWRPCVSPPNAWPEKWLYRIHPDDDAPPVQTEVEQPACSRCGKGPFRNIAEWINHKCDPKPVQRLTRCPSCEHEVEPKDGLCPICDREISSGSREDVKDVSPWWVKHPWSPETTDAHDEGFKTEKKPATVPLAVTKGTTIARDNRTECNALTDEQRKDFLDKAMQIVDGAAPAPTDPQEDYE